MLLVEAEQFARHPLDPTVGLHLGFSGGPRGVGAFLWAR